MEFPAPAFPSARESIAGVPIAQLAERFGTPTFVYDASVILRRLVELRSFDVVRYAQKACSNLAVVDLLRRGGAMVDAVSAGEIGRALRAGYTAAGEPHPIVYTADIFDAEALRLCIEHDIHVNCGSPDMIDQLGRAAPGRKITLRINPGFGHGHSRKTNTGGDQSKHGIWHEQLPDCLARARQYHLTVSGVHMHIGSGSDFEHLAQVCGALEKAALAVGPEVETVSVGGGLPVPYRPEQQYVDIDEYYRLCDAMRRRLESAWGKKIRLEIEPGRYLSAESGYLLSEIRAVKRQGENVFYLLDAGFNNLARPILYGAYHPMSVAFRNGGDPERLGPVIVGGPLCESGDIFTQEEGGFVVPRPLPAAQVGDWLVIEVAGAYGFVMGGNYNSRPLAAEVLIHRGQPHLVRRRQSFEEMIAGETTLPPDALGSE